MSKPRREYHPKRTAKAVRDHESTMSALGRAAGWQRKDKAIAIREEWKGRQHMAFVPGSTGIETWSQPSRLHKSAKEIRAEEKSAKVTPHTSDHPGHYWEDTPEAKHTTAKCTGCGMSSRINSAKDLNNFNK